MGLLYMAIETATMQVVQLGSLDVISSKQFLENPEAIVDTSPVSYGGSYSCYSKEQIKLMAENLGLATADTSYGDQINLIRAALVEKYKQQEPLQSQEYYENKLKARMKAEPELYKQFEPENPEPVTTKRFSGTKPNTSNTPKSAVARPAGGTTKKVWDIADDLKSRNPSLSAKELRPKIIEACENEGINGSTAGTQFAKWKNTQQWDN